MSVVADGSSDPRPPMLAGGVEVDRLDNGLTVALAADPLSPVVATTLWYRFGAADEGADELGAAHFLEHMMFKGSPQFAAGEVDRLTQALGGSNNAFTGHDATVYHFQFAADRWTRALAVEADRMASLTLDPIEVEREREVIVEEISMYRSDPWDALDIAARRQFFGDHPYARPILGTEESLQQLGAEQLNEVHRRAYDPANAVLVIAGGVGRDAFSRVAESFAGVARRGSGGQDPAPQASYAHGGRLVRRHGETDRLLVLLAAPEAGHGSHPALRLWGHLLSEGRSSRLHQSLVEEHRLCAWVSADLSDNVMPGCLSIAMELLPGSDPGEAEARLFEELEKARRNLPSAEEVRRSKRLFLADWVFGHEASLARALSIGGAICHHDLDFPDRYLDALLAVDGDALQAAASVFDPDSALVAWSRAGSESTVPSAVATNGGSVVAVGATAESGSDSP